MSRWSPLVICALAAWGSGACGSDLGPPVQRAAPKPDGKPALRIAGEKSARIASYRLDARYDATAHRIEATQTLTWKNTGGSTVTELPFHLYLNGFKIESTLFMTSSHGEHRGAVAGDGRWGWIDVTSITLAGAELRPRATFQGPDETVLAVPLPTPIEVGGSIELTMAFTAQLPEVFARTGYKGAFTMVGQWFPKVGVRVGAPGFERWHCPPFHMHTEFFADFGTYDVDLTVPDTHVVAATGVLVEVKDNGDRTRTLRYRAEDVHDFAWAIDPYLEMISGNADVAGTPVEVRVYFRPPQRDFAKRHLAAGIGAVETFSRLFVPYPWSIMTVVDPPPGADGAAGMEYPTLVTTAADNVLMRPGIRVPEFVTIHEIGHNWFQGILASNEFEEGWLDEGVNEWADGVVMAQLYGEKQSGIDWLGWKAEAFRLRRALTGRVGDNPSAIATAAYAFPDFASYGEATYEKTARTFRTLENLVGRDTFAAAMRSYAETWAFKHPTGADLMAHLSRSVNEDLSWFFRPALYEPGAVDYAVRTATCRAQHAPRGVFGEGPGRRTVGADQSPDTGGWACELVIVNRGTIPVPVDIDLRFEDGTHERVRWDARDGSRWHRFEMARSSPLAEVSIDPDGQVLLAEHVLDDRLRLGPDKHASWRATARLSYWTQSLMQVVGL